MLILDEPTSSLDPNARLGVWRELKKLCLQVNNPSAILLSTHDMQEATELSDKVLIMKEGCLMAQGSPMELVAKHCPAQQVRIPIKNSQGFREKITGLDQALQPVLFSEHSIDGPYVVYQEERLNTILKVIDKDDFYLDKKSIHQPTLEDVFMSVTGNELIE